MNPNDELQSDDATDDIVDPMFDALLNEFLTGDRPPDQTLLILQRLHETPYEIQTSRRQSTQTTSRRPTTKRWLVPLTVAASIAIVAGSMVASRQFINRQKLTHPVALKKPIVAPEIPVPQKPGPIVSADGATVAKPAPVTGIELASPTSATPSAEQTIEPSVPTSPATEKSTARTAPSQTISVQPMTLVSKSLDDQWQMVWRRLRVEPEAKLSAAKRAELVQSIIGHPVEVASVDDPERLRVTLSTAAVTKAIAGKLLGSMTRQQVDAIDQSMVASLGKTLAYGSGADRWLVGELQSGRWASLLAAMSDHETTVRTGALLTGQDLRCVRCHDLRDSTATTQSDYWQFAALVAPLVTDAAKNRKPNKLIFYDTADGRRRLAQPAMPSGWQSSVDQTKSLPAYLESLPGSQPVATGWVDALWHMVHGRPMLAASFDLTSAPQDESLVRLRQLLATDLVTSDFDLLRTLSLLLTDATFGRQTPEVMTDAGMLLADEEKWNDATTAVDSFAAGPPALDAIPRHKRLDIAVARVSGGLPNLKNRDSILAQSLNSSASSSVESAIKPTDSFPTRAAVIPPAWLDALSGFESRVQHISYLASRGDVTAGEMALAKAMQSESRDDALLWQRIWWLVR